MIKIDKNIPVPASGAVGRRAGDTKFPFADMEVGDSFFYTWNSAKAAQTAASAWNKRTSKGCSFRVRPDEQGGVQGFRLWRVG